MDDAKDYIAPDCVMFNPLISNEKLGGEGNDPVTKAMDNIQPLKAYKMEHKKSVVEIDMMAVQIMYYGTFTIYDGREVKAAVASTWRQTAGADWLLVAQLLCPTGDMDNEEYDNNDDDE